MEDQDCPRCGSLLPDLEEGICPTCGYEYGRATLFMPAIPQHIPTDTASPGLAAPQGPSAPAASPADDDEEDASRKKLWVVLVVLVVLLVLCCAALGVVLWWSPEAQAMGAVTLPP